MEQKRNTSGYVVGVGIGLVVLSVLNHYTVRADPVAHTTRIIFALGVVVALAGVALAVVSGARAR
jgi:hypothetical protein